MKKKLASLTTVVLCATCNLQAEAMTPADITVYPKEAVVTVVETESEQILKWYL